MMLGIDVDPDVYKALNDRKAPGENTLNDVLRSLLKLGVSTANSMGDARLPVLPTNAKPRQAPKADGGIKRIAVLGATGSIAGKVIDEALRRGIAVTAIARDPSKVSARDGVNVKAGDANEPGSLAAACSGVDAVVVSIRWPGIDNAKVIDGIRKAKVKRAIFVLGHGTSLREDGRRQYVHAAEYQGIPVPPGVPAVRALDALAATSDLDWTAVTCAQDIKSGERTGTFRVDGDARIVVDQNGKSRISEQDFAIAIIDELQEPHNVRRQICIGY